MQGRLHSLTWSWKISLDKNEALFQGQWHAIFGCLVLTTLSNPIFFGGIFYCWGLEIAKPLRCSLQDCSSCCFCPCLPSKNLLGASWNVAARETCQSTNQYFRFKRVKFQGCIACLPMFATCPSKDALQPKGTMGINGGGSQKACQSFNEQFSGGKCWGWRAWSQRPTSALSISRDLGWRFIICFILFTSLPACLWNSRWIRQIKVLLLRTYSDLFRVYQSESFARGQPCASPSTFFRTLRSSGWRQKLKFRHISNHAQCQICQRLKSGIKHAATIQRHAECADKYMRHLSGVYSDRQAYAQYKWRAIHQRDVITMIIDSMDKSKFRLPRFPHGRCPKTLENRKRPELQVTACICHGRGLFVYITDEDAATGSDWSLEVLSLSLNKAFELAQQSNEAWPSHLRLWTDNTPKEIF